jgi:hypothetical protein
MFTSSPLRTVARWTGTAWETVSPGVNYRYNSRDFFLRVLDDGSGPALYLAGDFLAQAEITSDNVARYRHGHWEGLPCLAAPTPDVTVHDDGSGPALYAPQLFATGSVARWTGGSWAPVPGRVDQNAAASLLSYDDGSGRALVAGGSFSKIGAANSQLIARWRAGAWEPLTVRAGGPDLPAWSVCRYNPGTGPLTVIGGDFTRAGDTPAARIAAWDGHQWSGLGSGMGGADAYVGALLAEDAPPGPVLYAGGHFATAGGVPARNIARWDGSAWSAVGDGTPTDAAVMLRFDDGSGPALYAGGPGPSIMRFDGSAWSTVGAGFQSANFNAYVASLAVYDDGRGLCLFAGGTFASSGGVAVNGIARWDGAQWNPVGNSGPASRIDALAVFDDGVGPALYAGGFIRSPNGATGSSAARWNGRDWTLIGPDGGTMSALQVFDDGQAQGSALYGALYTGAGGSIATGLLRWTNSRWVAVPSALGGRGVNYATQISSLYSGVESSRPALFAAGSFLSIDGEGSSGLAVWTCADPPCYANCDGSTVFPFLNVADFVCFQQRFAAGDPYANCDGSTTPPILSASDFICFLTRFAAGCP